MKPIAAGYCFGKYWVQVDMTTETMSGHEVLWFDTALEALLWIGCQP